MKNFILIPLILVSILLSTAALSVSVEQDAENTTFVVRWYDVGKAVLEGRPGIMSVESGWDSFREVNRVVYDPMKITVQEMEIRLKESGTYVKTLEN